jgi:hypothetical protein
MPTWLSPPQLVALAAFYERARAHPAAIADAEFVDAIAKAHWPTNCWSYVEASFAIIAPGCLMRPHLSRSLIALPIEAMIAGGLESADQVIELGLACAARGEHYVEPSEEGKLWLTREWPRLGDVVEQVFREKWLELHSDMD